MSSFQPDEVQMRAVSRILNGCFCAFLRRGCCVLFVLNATVAAAQEVDTQLEAVRSPTKVEIFIFVVDVFDIDSADQLTLVDFLVSARWHDESLAQKSDRTRFLDLEGLWSPELHVANERQLRRLIKDVLEVRPDGTVTHRQRYIGTIASRMNLANFPFDRHRIGIRMASPAHRRLTFEVREAESGQAETLTVADWDIGPGTIYLDPFRVAAGELSSVVYEFQADRHIGYYVWKVMLPLVLIVFMSWTVFWIDPSNFGPQIGAATASMLTLIAYRFALGNLIPKISYFTRMDSFITGSTILVFLALLQAVSTSKLATSERHGIARKIDYACRGLFPAAFVGVMVYSFWL